MAAEIHRDIEALPVRNSPSVRALRREYSKKLKHASPAYIVAVAESLAIAHDHRCFRYELVRYHRATLDQLDLAQIEAMGQGINSWSSVDCFGRILAGPAWLRGAISDDDVDRWAHSEDRWWRRAALVGTVAWNMRSQGGPGDAPRTLAVCRILAADPEDMVYKALSWALRELVVHDPEAVRAFLAEHDAVLAARVKREVRNKLETGLKNPRRG
jgi:3-methyladenine DNA glycosylase AlkD